MCNPYVQHHSNSGLAQVGQYLRKWDTADSIVKSQVAASCAWDLKPANPSPAWCLVNCMASDEVALIMTLKVQLVAMLDVR